MLVPIEHDSCCLAASVKLQRTRQILMRLDFELPMTTALTDLMMAKAVMRSCRVDIMPFGSVMIIHYR